ncbi:MAG: hypothetical protein IPK26_22745 [Planctomycetes bacterium]|nr:hypothetical protein [Planctomycetota bacterium]
MARFQVKKVVAVCFLEATKLTMDHLGQYRMELSQRGTDGPKDLTAQYGDLRRLRDYLQRCLGAFPDLVDLDLGAPDQGLLVAACRRAVEAIDARVETIRTLPAQEKDWLQRKRQVLADWAIELAARPLIELPLPRMSAVVTHGVKALNERLHQRIRGSDTLSPGADSGPLGTGFPLRSPGMSVLDQGPQDPVAATAALFDESVSPGGELPTRCQAGLSGAMPTSDYPPMPAAADYAIHGHDQGPSLGAGFARLDADPSAPLDAPPPLVDVRQIRDPRLRALMALDVRAYDRAVAASDHRLAAVHLSSILEGAILDHALPQRKELNLVGSPDGWNPQEVLLRIMGEACTPKDRSYLYQVFAARNLIRPTAQLVSPTVVTPGSLEKLTEFAQRAMREMGFHARGPLDTSGLDMQQRPSGYGGYR